MMKGTVFVLVLAGALGAQAATTEDGEPNRPMLKVVNMLKDMQTTLKEESDSDQDIYNKMACWCNNNKAAKEKEIEESEQRIKELDAAQKGAGAKIEKLKVEIKETEEELEANQNALNKAADMRREERAAYADEDKQYTDAITAMESAIAVLSRNYDKGEEKGKRWGEEGGAQGTQTALIQPVSMLAQSLKSHENLYAMALSGSEFEAFKAFVQANPATAAYSAGAGGGKQILGILKAMLENFQNNMSDSQKNEMEAEQKFQELKKTKEEQIQNNKDTIDTKNQDLADTMDLLSNADKDRAALKDSLKEARAFLLEVQTKCTSFQNEFDARVADRADEMKAVAKAIEILTSDEARATFSNTFNKNSGRANAEKAMFFLQKTSNGDKAVAILKAAAKKFHAPVLAQIANGAALDGFQLLKKKIDDIIADTKQNMQDEVKQRDGCVEQFAENEKKDALAKDDHESQVAMAEKLTAEIATLKDEIKNLHDEVKAMNESIVDAGNVRAKENAKFQQAISDQQAAIGLLSKALGVLKGYYNKQALLQQPEGFSAREGGKKGGGAGTVLTFLAQIIADSKKLEADTLNDEKDSQYQYEQLVQETNRSLAAKGKELNAKKEAKAKNEESHAENAAKMDETESDLQSIATVNSDLHASCDFLMKNFDMRQERQQGQIDALQEAKQILEGALA